MMSSRDPGAPTTAPEPAAVHPKVTAFAQAWQDGRRPSLDDFRAADPSLPETLLGPLACVELQGRLQAGEKARVEDYLQRYPELETMPDEVVRLIGAEYDGRRPQEPRLPLKEFTSRFPQYRTELQSLWQSGTHASSLPSTVGQAKRSQLAVPSSGTDAEPAPATVSDLKRPSSPGEVAEIETRIEPTPPAAARRGRGEQPLPVVPGYELEGLLGRGGMGVVYKARHLQLNRRVALKMILAGGHAGEDQLDRFLAEARAVARLQYPSIVQIHEIGELDGRPYFSLEFADGGSLASRLDGTPRPPRQSAHLVRTLAQAMHVAHQHGIVHRDLKPANVLMASVPGEHGAEAGDRNSLDRERWVPKIADFGLAKQLDQDAGQTQSGAIMGTPSYMAPEQAEGKVKEIGPAADVYALGVILYELLTGRVPFKGASVMETLEQVRTQEPVPLTQLQPKVSRDLETICLKCLHKEAPKRYASAADLAEDLRRFLDDEPIRARPVGEWDTFWRWCRRNPSLAGTSLVAVGAVSALIVLVILVTLNKADPGIAARAQLAEDQVKSYEKQMAELERGRKNVSAGDIDDLRRQLDELARNPGSTTAAQMDELRRRLNDLKPPKSESAPKIDPPPKTEPRLKKDPPQPTRPTTKNDPGTQPANDFREAHGLDRAAFEEWIRTLGTDYLPVFMNIQVGGAVRFNAIALKNTPKARFQFLPDVGSKNGGQIWNQMSADGYYLDASCLYVGSDRGVWEAQLWVENRGWRGASGVRTFDIISSRVRSGRADKVRPVHFSGVVAPTGSLYNYGFMQDGTETWDVEFPVARDQLGALADRQRARGWRVDRLFAYPFNGGVHFLAVVFANPDRLPWELAGNLSVEQYEYTLAQQKRLGRCPTAVASYVVSDMTLYAATWCDLRPR